MGFERRIEREARKSERRAEKEKAVAVRQAQNKATAAQYEQGKFLNDRLTQAANSVNNALKLRRRHRISANSWQDVKRVPGEPVHHGGPYSDYSYWTNTIYLEAWTKIEGIRIDLCLILENVSNGKSSRLYNSTSDLKVNGEVLTISTFAKALRGKLDLTEPAARCLIGRPGRPYCLHGPRSTAMLACPGVTAVRRGSLASWACSGA